MVLALNLSKLEAKLPHPDGDRWLQCAALPVLRSAVGHVMGERASYRAAGRSSGHASGQVALRDHMSKVRCLYHCASACPHCSQNVWSHMAAVQVGQRLQQRRGQSYQPMVF